MRKQKEPVTCRCLKVGVNGGTVFVDLTVQMLATPGALHGLVMIVFTETAAPEAAPKGRATKTVRPNERARELERELQQAREEVQRTREQMQASQEELKSMNEELQSTNEDLTMSKEEMQSLNEELQTVNAELQTKVDDRINGVVLTFTDLSLARKLEGELRAKGKGEK